MIGPVRACAMTLAILVVTFTAAAQTQAPATAPATAASAAAAKRNLTIDDYFRIKNVGDPRVSPDGKWVAYSIETASVKDDKSHKQIYMVAVGGGDPIALTAESSNASHPRWSPDGKYLAFLSSRSGGGGDSDDDDSKGGSGAKKQIWLLNRAGGEAQQLSSTIQDVDDFEWAPDSSRLVLVLQDPSPEELEFAKNKDAKPKPRPWVIDRLHFKEDEIGYLDRRRTHLFTLTLADKKLSQITSGDYDDVDPAWSPDGRTIAFVSNRSTPEPDRNYNTDIWTVAADNTDQGKTLVKVSKGDAADGSPAWSPDGQWIAYTTQLDEKLFQYATFHIAVAAASGSGDQKVLTTALDRNSSVPKFSPDGKFIYFIVDDDGTQQLLRVPATGGTIERPISGRKFVESFSLAPDGGAAAVIGELTHPAELYYLAAGGGRELQRLTHANDALMADLNLPDVEYVHFKSKDGTTVAGYMYKPVGYVAGTKVPTLLHPHGGPVWAYYAEFNFEPQLYAANGYAVLTPNPRGSSGYGQDYCKAIFADWGNKDFQDDMAAVDYAIAQGIADPDKLGVGGWSYGGISTNFIITQTTRFKAAISGAGEFIYITNWGHDHYSRDWEYELGLPWEHRDVWERLSPFSRVTKVTTPTLILGGDADVNVPVINGEQMYQSLKRLGVPTMLVVYPGEYHEFTRPTFIQDRYQRDLHWYGHYVKGEGPAVPPTPAPEK